MAVSTDSLHLLTPTTFYLNFNANNILDILD